MKNTIRVLGIIALALIIGFGMISCSDGSGPGSKPKPDPDLPDINTAFTISGSFEDTVSGIDAKFYATSTVSPTLSWSRNARATGELVEVALEGLLEDGDITFKLKGSYNSETKLYMLSAAASFMRYSISGDISKADSSTAVVQVKSGNTWTSIEVKNVSASVEGTPPEIDGSGEVEDELANGIPEEMWGVWWGIESLQKSKDDIYQPGSYYYVLDAYTIKQYVNRYNIWNLEGFTCFFEGATVENTVAKGRVEFTYTDQEMIANDTTDAIKNWWINHLVAYAQTKWTSVPGGQSTDSARIAEVLDNANQGWTKWSDSSWTAVLDKYKAPAQGDEGPLGTNQVWNTHFGPGTKFSYIAYRNDAYRIQNGQLQFGGYYATSNNDYFAKDPANITGFTRLKWGARHTRERSDAINAPATSTPVTGTWGVLKIPEQVTAIKHNSFEEKDNVLEVTSGAHWSVLDYSLSSYYGKGVKFTAISMDVWLEKTALVAWQLNNTAKDVGYPLLAGKWQELEAGQWHTVTLDATNAAKGYGVATHEGVLYLSTMQFFRQDSSVDETTLTENTIYVANVVIAAEVDTSIVVDILTPIESNMGSSEYGWENKKQALWKLSGDKLDLLRNSATLEFTLSKELTSNNLFLGWVIAADGYKFHGWPLKYEGAIIDGVTWDSATKKLSVDLAKLIQDRNLLAAQDNIDFFIEDTDATESINELGIISANLKGTYIPPVVDPNAGYNTAPAPFTPTGNVVWSLATHGFGTTNAETGEITGYLNGPLEKNGNAKFYNVEGGINVRDREQYSAVNIMFTGNYNLSGSPNGYGVNTATNDYRITVRGNAIGTPPDSIGMAIQLRDDPWTWLISDGVWDEAGAFELVWDITEEFTGTGVSIVTSHASMPYRINLIVVEDLGPRGGLASLPGGINLSVAGDDAPVFDADSKVVTVTGSSESLFYFSWEDAGINWSEVNFYDSIRIHYAAVIETQEAIAKVVIKKGLNSWEGDLGYVDIQAGTNRSFPLLTKTQLGTTSEGVSFQHNSYNNPGASLYHIKILSVEVVPGVDPGINWEDAAEPFTLTIAVDSSALNASGVGVATKASHAISGDNLTIPYSGTARQTGIIAIPADKKELLFKAASAGGKAIVNINGTTSNESATYRACLGSIEAGGQWDGSTWIGGSGFTAWSANSGKTTAIGLTGTGFTTGSDRFGWLVIQSENAASTLTITSVTITIVEP